MSRVRAIHRTVPYHNSAYTVPPGSARHRRPTCTGWATHRVSHGQFVHEFPLLSMRDPNSVRGFPCRGGRWRKGSYWDVARHVRPTSCIRKRIFPLRARPAQQQRPPSTHRPFLTVHGIQQVSVTSHFRIRFHHRACVRAYPQSRATCTCDPAAKHPPVQTPDTVIFSLFLFRVAVLPPEAGLWARLQLRPFGSIFRWSAAIYILY